MPATENSQADPTALSVGGTGRAIAGGSLTSAALTEALLARIDAREPAVHAWAWLDPDAALAQARERDREITRGPLHGVPIGIKDLIDTADMPTSYGSPIHRNNRPADDNCVLSNGFAEDCSVTINLGFQGHVFKFLTVSNICSDLVTPRVSTRSPRADARGLRIMLPLDGCE